MKTVTPISARGFTLIELLLVVAILAILSTVVVVVINPAELLKQARDAIRLSDLGAVNKTLSISQVNAIPLGSSTIVYVSIPDISATCANLGLPTLPTGWSYQCAPSSSYLNANGTGWIPVNFNLIPGGSSLGALPIDPVNTTSSGFYYLYVPGSTKWAIAAGLESQKYFPKAANDSGYDPGRYEIGTDLSLIAKAENLAGWWKFEEGSSQYAYDSSGNGNTGTLINGPAWAGGKVGGAINFSGNQYVSLLSMIPFSAGQSFTIEVWAKLTNLTTSAQGMILGTNLVTSDFFWLCVSACDYVRYRNSAGTSYDWTGISGSWEDTNWHYYVLTSDGSKATLYIDGDNKTSKNAVTSLQINAIGRGYSTDNFDFIGYLDEIRVYNRTRSAAEISATYNATK